MRAWCFTDGFGFESLHLVDRPDPEPGPRDVVIAMRAASLNFRDLVVLRGQHGRAVRPPLIPLSDGCGVVTATGAEVGDLAVGTRVAPAFFRNWQGGAPPQDLEAGRLGGPLDGVLATRVVAPADAVVRIPDHLSDAEAATLPCAGVTAWSALSEPRPARAGETVLILGTGGVALMALQLARVSGLRTVVTTSSDAKAERLRALGADIVIDRSATPDWARAVREATGGAGVDRVLELAGAETLPSSLKCVRTGGTILLIGNVTGNEATLFLPAILTRRVTLQSVTVGSRQDFEALVRALDLHGIRPVVDRTLPFEDAPEAFRTLETQAGFGNICVEIPGD
ncbi:zinc-binding dehydrogenase [Rhodobacterales bacterium HKCCE3408]|nr:zinc-binding dehydrogenase [Rhodobacterales bacterium HKCCE3408]